MALPTPRKRLIRFGRCWSSNKNVDKIGKDKEMGKLYKMMEKYKKGDYVFGKVKPSPIKRVIPLDSGLVVELPVVDSTKKGNDISESIKNAYGSPKSDNKFGVKFSSDDAMNIYRAYHTGERTISALAKDYGVCLATVRSVIRGKTYSDETSKIKEDLGV